jgi:hypothetical protein
LRDVNPTKARPESLRSRGRFPTMQVANAEEE